VTEFANPDVLVTTEWIDNHKDDPDVAVIEVDVDAEAYVEGHIPGAVAWSWRTQLCDQVERNIIKKTDLEVLLGYSGITQKTKIVLYGDNNNWFATWAFWQLKLYKHENVYIMDGGRKKWLAEGREVSTDVIVREKTVYYAKDPDFTQRAFLTQVQAAYPLSTTALIDVRSRGEYTGEIIAPPGLPETAQRGGHIPGALNINWRESCNEDGTFKSYDDLKTIFEQHGVTADKHVIIYCRIGERSSHTWFVLKYLLGYPNVRNYDGSWTEWGSLVGAPIEVGE